MKSKSIDKLIENEIKKNKILKIINKPIKLKTSTKTKIKGKDTQEILQSNIYGAHQRNENISLGCENDPLSKIKKNKENQFIVKIEEQSENNKLIIEI